jgi:hypothetical protein
MNQDIKRRWVEALRSGQYKQGQLFLHSEDSFCCLGVLTDLYCLDHNIQWRKAWLGSAEKSFNSETERLHPKVLEWAGLNSPDPIAGSFHLSQFNDNGGTFTQIADLIERHL